MVAFAYLSAALLLAALFAVAQNDSGSPEADFATALMKLTPILSVVVFLAGLGAARLWREKLWVACVGIGGGSLVALLLVLAPCAAPCATRDRCARTVRRRAQERVALKVMSGGKSPSNTLAGREETRMRTTGIAATLAAALGLALYGCGGGGGSPSGPGPQPPQGTGSGPTTPPPLSAERLPFPFELEACDGFVDADCTYDPREPHFLIRDLPDADIADARRSPVTYDWARIFVGVDQGTEHVAALPVAAQRGDTEIRFGDLGDGIGAARVGEYLSYVAPVHHSRRPQGAGHRPVHAGGAQPGSCSRAHG